MHNEELQILMTVCHIQNHLTHAFCASSRAKLLINKTGSVCVTQRWGAFVQPLLLWKSSKYCIFWVVDCSLSYPACQSLAPCYIVTCGLSDSSLFVHISLSHKWHKFRIKLLNIKCVLIFIESFIWNFPHSRKKRIEWDVVINVYCAVSIILIIL